jgi:tRNA 2-selenouridine synthase
MAVQRIAADAALARLASFSAIIDVRSQSEFAEDHLPGALNWPSLADAERVEVGTIHQQVSPFDARKRGAAMVARNIAAHLEREASALPREWAPLVYCWRGGQRSGSLATVLDAIGFRVTVLEGGYREFRRAVVRELEVLPAKLTFQVLCGRTGSGKSRLLGTLEAQGSQVLDLEALACHRGSVLGPLPGQPQPSQKAFETAIWHALGRFDPQRTIWAESESRTIGRLRVPEALLARLRASDCVAIEMPLGQRVELLMQDYGHFVRDTGSFCLRLQSLAEHRGADVVKRWQRLAREGRHAEVVRELLEQHYDPTYMRSMARNYARFGTARIAPLVDGSAPSLRALADSLAGA